MMTMSEAREAARAEVAWTVRERARAAALARGDRARFRAAGVGGVRRQNALVRFLALARVAGTVSCGTALARARSARSLRAWAEGVRERTNWDALWCGQQDALAERLERACFLADALEAFGEGAR